MSVSDNELMQRVIGHDDLRAFDELVLRHRKSAVVFARRYTEDYYLAEDLAQEAFARIYVKRKEYKLTGEFKPYLYRILRNLCIDSHRRQVRRPESVLTEDIYEVGPTPEEMFLQRETYGVLQRLFRSLDERYRTVLFLQEYEGMTYERIAEVMGITQGQVRMLLYRGRRKFKKLAEEELRVDERLS